MTKKKRKQILQLSGLHIFYIILCLLALVPILYALNLSFERGSGALSSGLSLFPKEFTLDNYKNIPIFSKLNYRHTPETISYFYTLLGDVVFLNTTKDIKRHGYTGLFILPLEVSPEQKEQTLEFADSLKEYQVRILHHLSLEYGILNGEEMQQTLCNSPKELLLHYFEHVNSKKK